MTTATETATATADAKKYFNYVTDTVCDLVERPKVTAAE